MSEKKGRSKAKQTIEQQCSRCDTLEATFHHPEPATVKRYLEICDRYKVVAHPAVLVCLRYALHTFRPAKAPVFTDADMVPFGDLIIEMGDQLSHIEKMDFSQTPVTSHTAEVLGHALMHLPGLKGLNMHDCRIGRYGADALKGCFDTHPNISSIKLRGCLIGSHGAKAFAHAFETRGNITDVDLSNNNMGYSGLHLLGHVLSARSASDLPNLKVDLDGNAVLAEVMNVITHGIGIVLCGVGTGLLLARAAQKSSTHLAACLIYSIALCLLYTSSTLYHSFFALKRTKFIFGIIDHSAIYLLIAGTYTPYLSILLNHKPVWSVYLQTFLWVCCVLGISIAAAYHGTWRTTISLALYLSMGWAAVFAIKDIVFHLHPQGLFWLVMGGLCYTGGVPFFVADKYLYHAIWHVFVLCGSLCHYVSIYNYVAPFDLGAVYSDAAASVVA